MVQRRAIRHQPTCGQPAAATRQERPHGHAAGRRIARLEGIPGMTLIQSLLTELGGSAFARSAEAGRSGRAVLSLSNNMVLSLDMSSDEEHLLLSSAPGSLPASIDT